SNSPTTGLTFKLRGRWNGPASKVASTGAANYLVATTRFRDHALLIGLAEPAHVRRQLNTLSQDWHLAYCNRQKQITASTTSTSRKSHDSKRLCDLAVAGITTAKLRQSLEHLRSWMPTLERPLEQLALL